MYKLSFRVKASTYMMSIKPTEPQLDYFIGKQGLSSKDYWKLMNAKKENPYLYQKYKNAINKAYEFAINEFWNRAEELVEIVDVNSDNGFYFLLNIPDEWALKQLSNMPVVRNVIKTKDFINIEDRPEVLNEKSLKEWNPYG